MCGWSAVARYCSDARATRPSPGGGDVDQSGAGGPARADRSAIAGSEAMSDGWRPTGHRRLRTAACGSAWLATRQARITRPAADDGAVAWGRHGEPPCGGHRTTRCARQRGGRYREDAVLMIKRGAPAKARVRSRAVGNGARRRRGRVAPGPRPPPGRHDCRIAAIEPSPRIRGERCSSRRDRPTDRA